jgi:MFS transporter, UMF1 family
MSHAADARGTRGEIRGGVLFRLGLHRRELRAWAMYDWANSAAMTTVIAAVFPTYYAAVATGGDPRGMTTFQAATTAGIIFVALISPILGAIADFSAVKKRMLATFMTIGVAAIAGMFFIQHGDWMLATILFVVANIGLMGSFVFYESLLPHIASQDEVDRVSTGGYALGYLGGGLLLALNLAWIVSPATFGLPSGPDLTPAEATLPVRLAFLSVALWWAIFAIPLFRRVPEPPRRLEKDERGDENPLRIAFTRLRETFRELRGYKYAFLMLLAFLIYSDGIGTIIRMATIYGTHIGIERNALIMAILITQFVGFPFAFIFGMLAGWIGAKPSIFIGLAVYVAITILAFFMTTAAHFLLLAVLVGMVQGGTQALSRSVFATLIPIHKSGEFFGFFGVMDRFSGSMGTALMMIVMLFTDQIRYSIVAIVVFFVVGAFILRFVDVEAGQRQARQAELDAVGSLEPVRVTGS